MTQAAMSKPNGDPETRSFQRAKCQPLSARTANNPVSAEILAGVRKKILKFKELKEAIERLVPALLLLGKRGSEEGGIEGEGDVPA